jgi:hypothetical protein
LPLKYTTKKPGPQVVAPEKYGKGYKVKNEGNERKEAALDKMLNC